MLIPSKSPTYNLKVVVRETGIKPDTLRAWERRYGLPEPDRTQGGHRLYSEYDIETIKWLMERQEEGMRINRAVALWQDIESSGKDPLAALPLADAIQQPILSELTGGEKINELRESWVQACLAFDEPSAEYALAQAFSRYPLETVCLEVLREGVAEIGELWYQGEATVQQEHFASALAIRRLDALIAAAPSPTRPSRILVACPPGDDHVFSPLLITLFLRHHGYNVVYLGANVPLEQLEGTINKTQPQLVVMTAYLLNTAASLYEVAKYLYTPNVRLAYGGPIFNHHPDLRDLIPGFFLGQSLDKVVNNIEAILGSRAPIPEPELIPDNYQRALAHFRDKQAELEAFVWENIRTNGMKEYHLEIANDFLGRDILAALSLGNMNYLQNEMDWLRMLLSNHNIPLDLLPRYVDIYSQALSHVLEEEGKPVIDWMEQIKEK